MDLQRLVSMDDDAWDARLNRYSGAFFSHTSAWLALLAETHHAERLRFRLVHGGRTVGLFAAFRMRKGPFRLLVSPPARSETEYLGPAAGADLDVEAFLDALDRWCMREGIHQVELGHACLAPEVLCRHGYETHTWTARVLKLSRDRDIMWRALPHKCRNRISKALRTGLTVDDSDDPGFPDEHYRQLVDVYSGQGMSPPFPIEFYRNLHRRMKADGRLLALRVCHDGRCIASGLFPYDDRQVYSVSTASYAADQHVCPNERLHWAVMETAGGKGIARYNIGDNYRRVAGSGAFKDKFGGQLQTVHRHVKSYVLAARFARAAFRHLLRAREAIGMAGRRRSRA